MPHQACHSERSEESRSGSVSSYVLLLEIEGACNPCAEAEGPNHETQFKIERRHGKGTAIRRRHNGEYLVSQCIPRRTANSSHHAHAREV